MELVFVNFESVRPQTSQFKAMAAIEEPLFNHDEKIIVVFRNTFLSIGKC